MMNRRLTLTTLFAAALAAGAPGLAAAHGGRPAGTPSSTGSTASIPTTAVSFDLTNNCRGGGTSAMKGSYDPTTGAISSSVTLTSCVSGTATHTGTVTTTGSLVAGSAANTYTLALTSTYDTTVTNGTDSVARKCTWSKNGTYDMTAQTFTGTVTKSNCGLTLTETQRGDIVQHLLRDSLQMDH